MGIEVLTAQDLTAHAVGVLGLDPEAVDLLSAEAMAASLRRAASFLCPTTSGALTRAVDETLVRLPGYTDDTRWQIEAVLASLVSYGDLLELPYEDEGVARRRLFLGVPAFVRRASDTCLLIGVRPEGAPLVRDDLLAKIEYDAHVRLIRATTPADAELLVADRLTELQPEQWFGTPRIASPEEVVSLYTARLDVARASGDIEGLRIIDPATSVTYYRGRWRPPKPTDTGRFVARRPQAFGADLWCFAEIAGGRATRLVDLPIGSVLVPAADEAWRLQAAIDCLAGHRQRVAVYTDPRSHRSVVDLFSPVPSWMQRRLDVVGTPLLRSRGALFSYALPDSELHEELECLRTMLWTVDASIGGMADAG
jgi:hypothetical protein